MYSTSSEHTRSPATAHSYNITFSEEIGHFEFCDNADPSTLACTAAGVNDKGVIDADDVGCFTPSQFFFPSPPIIQIGGCTGSDFDFDGVSYRFSWPGTLTNAEEKEIHPTPVRFTSPLFFERSENGEERTLKNYDRVAFEADLPLIENATSPACDVLTGRDCVNPPIETRFYPIFSTAHVHDRGCEWQFGGTHIPGTTNTFGGNSKTEFGILLGLVTQDFSGSTIFFDNFRRILDENPCRVTHRHTDFEQLFAVLGAR
jgi:hypothetical protein